MKSLKLGAGVPSIPTGRGILSTSVPSPLFDNPMLPKKEAEAGLEVVVGVSFFFEYIIGLNPWGLLEVYIDPGTLDTVEEVAVPDTRGEAKVGSLSEVRMTSPLNRARR